MIRILFFAQLREQLGCSEIKLEVATPLSVLEARQKLIEKNPSWGNFLSQKKILSAVNQQIVKDNHPIQLGDEVAFFPPVTGG